MRFACSAAGLSRNHGALALMLLLAGLVIRPVAAFDLQGHRGARGLAPENTLAAFAKALEIGVTTLETDLAVTKDGVLVISHNTMLDPTLVRGPDGKWLSSRGPAIHSLTLEEIKRFDIGRIKPWSIYALRFYRQTPVDGERFPTLEEVFQLVKASGKPARLNIETKISPDKPNDTPDPETFAKLVVDAVRAAGMADRTTIQSFDWRTLLVAKQLAPEIEAVCLTSDAFMASNLRARHGRPSPWLAGLDPAQHRGSVPRLAKAAGCGTWSPRQEDLSVELVEEAHALALKVVPWTVNSDRAIGRIIDMKVDGLITDYPDRARAVMAQKGMALPH